MTKRVLLVEIIRHVCVGDVGQTKSCGKRTLNQPKKSCYKIDLKIPFFEPEASTAAEQGSLAFTSLRLPFVPSNSLLLTAPLDREEGGRTRGDIR